jgi:hypothetical protein
MNNFFQNLNTDGSFKNLQFIISFKLFFTIKIVPNFNKKIIIIN